MVTSSPACFNSLVMIVIALFAAVGIPTTMAIKFDLPAMTAGVQQKNNRCVTAYIGKNVLVRGEYETGSVEHQDLQIRVYDNSVHSNKYYQRNNIDGRGKFAFTTLDHAEVFICFTNILEQGFIPSPTIQRSVSITLDTGADAQEDSDFENKQEHLKPVEIELRRLESVMEEIVDEMEYLKHRSRRMRNTNESTNSRVLWFSILSIATLILLGIWQIMYLRHFFAAKKLI